MNCALLFISFTCYRVCILDDFIYYILFFFFLYFLFYFFFFFFSSRRRHTRCLSDWSSDVCSSDLDRRNVRRGYIQSGAAEGVVVPLHQTERPRDPRVLPPGAARRGQLRLLAA